MGLVITYILFFGGRGGLVIGSVYREVMIGTLIEMMLVKISSDAKIRG